MKNSLEITRGYQFGYMILQHIKAVLICVAFEACAFWSFLDGAVSKLIVAAVFTLVYAMMLYSGAKKLSVFDNKPYTPLEPSLKYGFLWGAVIALTMVAFIILFKFNWTCVDNTAVLITINIFCYLWTGPYFGFYGAPGELSVYAMILMIVIPMLMTTLGYYAGIKKFDILEKLDSLTFEKDEDEE